ncbi:MAG: terminase gpA endonuclease subunit, partial [bacterium]
QDLDWKGERVEGGVALWIVGTDTAKGELYARLRLPEPGPRYVHFPATVEDEYFEQLTGEKLVTRYQRGVPRLEWLRVRRRQEALDCEVYAYAAALRAGLARAKWDAIEREHARRREAAPTVTGETPQRPAGEGPPRLPSIFRSRWLSR